jgi:CHAT domain-containing protein/predicted negative regulator of RcsB-dependent stress response
MGLSSKIQIGRSRTSLLSSLLIYGVVGATQLFGQAIDVFTGKPAPSLLPPIPPVNSVPNVSSMPGVNLGISPSGNTPGTYTRPTEQDSRWYIEHDPNLRTLDPSFKQALIYNRGNLWLNSPTLPNGVQNPLYQSGGVTPNWYLPGTWPFGTTNWDGVQPNGFLPASSIASSYGASGTPTYNPTINSHQYTYPAPPTLQRPVQPIYQSNLQTSPRPTSSNLPQISSFRVAQPTAPAMLRPSATDLARATASSERALALTETAGDKVGQATNHAALAQLFVQQGQLDLAFTHLRAAEAIYDTTVDPAVRVNLLRTKGAAYLAAGEFESAIHSYREALSNLSPLSDKAEQAEIQTSIGWAYQSLGDFLQALKSYKEAQALFTEAGNKDGKVRTALGIGSLYASIGEREKAIQQYRSVTREASSEQFARMLVSNAEMLESINMPEEALDRYAKALSVIESGKNRSPFPVLLPPWAREPSEIEPREKASLEISILAGMGRSHMALGRFFLAESDFEQARAKAKDSGNRAVEAGIIASIGELAYWKEISNPKLECWHPTDFRTLCSFKKPQLSEALKEYQEAMPLMRLAANRMGEIGVLTNTGLVYDAQGKRGEALRYYGEALQQMDDLERAARLEEFRINIASQSAGLYQRAIELEAGRHHMEEAFNLSERARARTLLDQLGNPRIDLGKSAPVSFLELERKLRRENIMLRRQLGQELAKPGPEVNVERTRSLQARLVTVRTEYDDAVRQLKLSNPAYASFLSISPLTLREAQQQLDRDVTLLSYFTTQQTTLAFVLTKDTFYAAKLPVTAGSLSSAISTFLDFAGDNGDSPDLRFLYNSLIKPIKGKLKTSTLIVVPHGVLNDLPFAALTSDGKSYLNDRYAIAYLPSVSILPYVRSRVKPGGSKALILANDHDEGVSHLDHAYGEALAIAPLLGTRPLLGIDATASALRARAGDADIIHLIAHFDFDSNNPQSTRILLGQDKENDEPLDLKYVASLNLQKTNLVVLSGCQTQLGKRSRGDDVIGLGPAFMYAGSPSVLASLWSVDDDATQKLMIAFYTHLNDGLGKAEALRAAQIDIRQQYSHPYYWAGFVLTGDPGSAKNSLQARTTR